MDSRGDAINGFCSPRTLLWRFLLSSGRSNKTDATRLGGGVIGASIAYFLTRRGLTIVVERTGVAHAASGKSGGFLALDWCDGTPLQALARRSFALHASLASELGGDWGFRRMDTYGGFARVRRGAAEDDEAPALPWLSKGVAINQRLGTGATTAQVHPGAFTKAMMRAAEARGAELRRGALTGILREDGGRVRGVEMDAETLSADAVVIAMGPCRILARRLRSSASSPEGPRSVFDTDRGAGEALFLESRRKRRLLRRSCSAHRRTTTSRHLLGNRCPPITRM